MIYETVITTVNTDGSAHIAPFGIREHGDRVIISPFRPSTSLDNLLRTKQAVVNLTDDVRIFAGALTGRRDWPVRRADNIDGFVLDAALAHRELMLVETKEDAVRPELSFKVVQEITHKPFRGFNRAQAAVLEAAVLVSRVQILPPEKVCAEIANFTLAVVKTAREREMQAWNWLIERIENYNAGLFGDNQA